MNLTFATGAKLTTSQPFFHQHPQKDQRAPIPRHHIPTHDDQSTTWRLPEHTLIIAKMADNNTFTAGETKIIMCLIKHLKGDLPVCPSSPFAQLQFTLTYSPPDRLRGRRSRARVQRRQHRQNPLEPDPSQEDHRCYQRHSHQSHSKEAQECCCRWRRCRRR